MTTIAPIFDECLGTEPTLGDHEMTHVTCCQDDDVLLCGDEGKGVPWAAGTPWEAACVECAAVVAAQTCPKFRRCIDQECAN